MYTPENQHETQNRRFAVIFRFQPFVLSVSLSWGMATKPATWTMISWLVQVPGSVFSWLKGNPLKQLDRISSAILTANMTRQPFIYDPDSTNGYKMGPPSVTQGQKRIQNSYEQCSKQSTVFCPWFFSHHTSPFAKKSSSNLNLKTLHPYNLTTIHFSFLTLTQTFANHHVFALAQRFHPGLEASLAVIELWLSGLATPTSSPQVGSNWRGIPNHQGSTGHYFLLV